MFLNIILQYYRFISSEAGVRAISMKYSDLSETGTSTTPALTDREINSPLEDCSGKI